MIAENVLLAGLPRETTQSEHMATCWTVACMSALWLNFASSGAMDL